MNTEELKKYDYVVLLDKSGSMSTEDCVGGKSRWQHMQEQAENIARVVSKFDDDGIDVIVFGSSVKEYKGVTAQKVTDVFKENQPGGSTNTAGAVETAFNAYFARKTAGSAKPCIVLCFTDGTPDDKAKLEQVIIGATKKMDVDEELAITFLQVGSDGGARDFLKNLDDGLEAKGAKFDIVDTKDDAEMEGLSVEDILVQAVTD